MSDPPHAPDGALPHRLPGIDILRAVAALAVAVSHLVQTTLPEASARGAKVWTTLGSFGVGLFFVISGFCIHAPLVRREIGGASTSIDYRAFYRRRFLRLYPAHLVALAVSIGVAALIPFPKTATTLISVTTPAQLALHVMMLHTFSAKAFYSGNGVLWSLAVETHFYLAYPAFLALRRRFGSARVCVALACVSGAVAFQAARLPSWFQILLENAPFRWWEWIVGCVVVEVALRRPPSFRHGYPVVIAFAAVTAAIGMGLLTVHGGSSARFFIWPVLFAGTILAAAWMRAPSSGSRMGLVPSALNAVGQASYSLYLVHPIAYHVAIAALVALAVAVPGMLAGMVLVCAAFTWAFYRLVERPFMTRAMAAGAPAGPDDVVTGSALR